MKAHYECPSCNNCINVGEDIVLVAKNEVGEKGLTFLHTDLGNYSSKFSCTFDIKEGEKLSFLCPVCHHNLTNHKNDRLAYVIYCDADNKQFRVIFSQVFGEKCTYKVEEHKVVENFGEHWNFYQDPDWFMFF